MSERFSLSKTIRSPIPALPWERMKDKILGKNYALSIVFIGGKKSASLNKKLRKKNKSANILTFPLSSKEGEIYLTPTEIKKDAKKFGLGHRQFFARR